MGSIYKNIEIEIIQTIKYSEYLIYELKFTNHGDKDEDINAEDIFFENGEIVDIIIPENIMNRLAYNSIHMCESEFIQEVGLDVNKYEKRIKEARKKEKEKKQKLKNSKLRKNDSITKLIVVKTKHRLKNIENITFKDETKKVKKNKLDTIFKHKKMTKKEIEEEKKETESKKENTDKKEIGTEENNV